MTLPAWLHEPLVRGIGQRGHALLVHGPGDVGQFTFGQALAAAWLCENPASNNLACGQCVSCKLLSSGTHSDYRLLVPDALRVALGLDSGDEDTGDDKPSKAKPSKEIRIDAVRSALDWAHSTSARGRAKVLLIHPADALNMVAANALLKTLEEPPGRLRLVLTTQDPDVLLPTVRSRCQRLPLPMPERGVALAWLAEQGVGSVEDAEVLWAAAGGRPGDALALSNDGITAQTWSELPQAVRRGQAQTAWPLPRLVDALQKLCLDLLALEQGAAARYFSAEALKPLAGAKPSMAALLEWSQMLMQAARHAEHPWHSGLKAEALFAHAQALWQTPRNAGPGKARPTATLRRS
jgi:DNA polymerase III subunit delta'